MSIKVKRKLHDMRILGRIVGIRSTEQSVRHLLTLISFYCRNRHTHPAYAFISFTSRLVPRRDAPSPMNFSASSKEEMPPAALTLTFFPTWVFISFTSANVAPSVENPVDVLMYSAPAFVTISHILIFLLSQQTVLNDYFQDPAIARFVDSADLILDFLVLSVF